MISVSKNNENMINAAVGKNTAQGLDGRCVIFSIPDTEKALRDGLNPNDVKSSALAIITTDLMYLYAGIADYYGADTLTTVLDVAVKNYMSQFME